MYKNSRLPKRKDFEVVNLPFYWNSSYPVHPLEPYHAYIYPEFYTIR